MRNNKGSFFFIVLAISLFYIHNVSFAESVDFFWEDKARKKELFLSKQFDELEALIQKSPHFLETGMAGGPEYEQLLNKWVAAKPESYIAHYMRCVHYEALGWVARGRNYINKTLREQLVLRKFYHDKAIEDCKKAIELNVKKSKPYAMAPYSKLMHLYKMSGQRSNLEDITREAFSRFPESAYIWEELLSSLEPRWGGSYEALAVAIETMRKVADASEDPSELLASLKWREAERKYWEAFEEEERDFSEARALYLEALDLKEKSEYYKGLADTYFYGKEYHIAAYYYRKMLDLNPSASRTNLASIYGTWGDQQKKLQLLSRDVFLRPYDPKALWPRGYLYQEMGRYEEAKADFDRGLIYGYFNHDLQFWRGYFYYLHLKDYDEAINSFQVAYQLEPDDVETFLHLGKAYYQKGTELYGARDCSYMKYFSHFIDLCMAKGCVGQGSRWIRKNMAFFKKDCPAEFLENEEVNELWINLNDANSPPDKNDAGVYE